MDPYRGICIRNIKFAAIRSRDRKKANEGVPVRSGFGMVEVSTLRAGTLERRIVLKYDMTALSTLVPVSTSNGRHDFEMGTFDAVGAANNGDRFGHEGRAGESAQLS
jgi:hypothetical protein